MRVMCHVHMQFLKLSLVLSNQIDFVEKWARTFPAGSFSNSLELEFVVQFDRFAICGLCARFLSFRLQLNYNSCTRSFGNGNGNAEIHMTEAGKMSNFSCRAYTSIQSVSDRSITRSFNACFILNMNRKIEKMPTVTISQKKDYGLD